MILTHNRLVELLRLLDVARCEATGPHSRYYCNEPNLNESGENFRWEPKTQRAVGSYLQDGTPVEAMPDGRPGIRIPLGVHGRAFLGIDTRQGKIVCTECKK